MKLPPLLVDPTEQPQAIKQLGRSSSVPAKFGVDILCPTLRIGWQRKELRDLVSSIHSGRLARQAQQMAQHRLTQGFIVIEGNGRWTSDGQLLDGWAKFDRASYHGLILSIQHAGLRVMFSSDPRDTARAVKETVAWWMKDSHTSLSTRGKFLVSTWGKADNEEWAAYVLQGFPDIGPKTAKAIVKHFGGLPLSWGCTETELRMVKGVGKKRARGLVGALERKVKKS